MKERKHEAPPRYDAAFKEGAIRLVTQEGRPMREVAQELGVCVDTIRNWLRAAGIQPTETERQNRMDRRQRDLEAEIRSLRKQLAQKDEVIDILKKSVGILSKP
ncbi:transposase [Ruminococcus sp.]|uniref:transposase n=1 Tax=Ruminococcus sp. TaxID=41978 RepID=UPI0026062669|nr:transposase [Ruminococcus sp.]MDD7555933.1 transposase [Ruminococcus sp.]